MTAIHRPHLDFALNLYGALPREGNLAWSPYSVASALGLAAAGARGETRAQLESTLAPAGDLSELGRTLARSADLREAAAAVANSLWMREGLPFEDAYQKEVLGWPGGAVHLADFLRAADRARLSINSDVEKTTEGLIKELLPPGSIDQDTAAVLVNALYLKVAWKPPFSERSTKPMPFQAPSGTRQVPTMRQTERMPYASVDGWHMVSLPTESEIAADVILPNGDLDADTFARLHAAARPAKIDLALPKLRVETSAPLRDPLSDLGVADAFDRDRADFSAMTPAQVWIDAVLHKTVLNVDEEGFEGAAATAVIMTLMSADIAQPIPFHVDRPFLLFIRNTETGAIYFMARVENP